jgi:hypothetical protein
VNISRRWILRIVGFLVALVVGDLAAGMIRVNYWTPFQNPQALRIFTYQRRMPPADILFLGSSRVRALVMPETIEGMVSSRLARDVRTYCLGQNGGNVHTSRLILDDAIASHGRPDIIVLEVSPGAFNRNHANVVNDLRFYSSIVDIVGAVRWIDRPERVSAAAAGSFRGISSLALFGSRWLYPGQFEAELSKYMRRRGAQFPPLPHKRHRRLSDHDPAARSALLETAVADARANYMRDYSVGGAPEAGFWAIVHSAAADGIPLVLMDPPVWPDYRSGICSADEHAAYREVIELARRQSHPPVVEADFDGLHLTADDFLDITHLRPNGSIKASRHLTNEVLLPLLRDLERN